MALYDYVYVNAKYAKYAKYAWVRYASALFNINLHKSLNYLFSYYLCANGQMCYVLMNQGMNI